MAGFSYRKGELFCDGTSVEKVSEKIKTPFYLYSYEKLKGRVEKYKEAFSDQDSSICYALKANSNGAILSLLAKEGLGADVVSGGELRRALNAGIPPENIVFAGVGKTKDEFKNGLREEILAFNVESFPELNLLNKVAKREEKPAPVSLRVNPNIDPQTHPYISTGLEENKFGIDFSEAERGYEIAKSKNGLEPIGIHAHIGSQIVEAGPFKDAVSKLVSFIKDLKEKDIELQFIDTGGGLGIPYKKKGTSLSVQRYAEVIKSELNKMENPPEIIVEPGRSIVGPAGILISEVKYVKEKGEKNFVILDAGMNDFIRPSLYEARHEILSVKYIEDRAKITADVVGPVCESSDFFAKDRDIPGVESGERLAIMDTGAYGYSMASNYNSRVRPAEVLVKDGKIHTIRKREELGDLTEKERIPPFLE